MRCFFSFQERQAALDTSDNEGVSQESISYATDDDNTAESQNSGNGHDYGHWAIRLG